LGVLPDLLTQLLAQRAYVKGLQKKLDKSKPEEKALWEVLENRQLALKLCCNSVYGFLKAFILVDPRLMAAVTDWGQAMIKKTASIVETHYKDNEIVDRKACERLGSDFEAQPKEGEADIRPKMKYSPRIIYGDT
jgi:DNA polymerase delta subunit 1